MVKIPNEILDALSKIRINGEYWQILSCILKLGSKKKYLSLKSFSYQTGINVSHVWRGLKHLLSRNIIVKFIEEGRIYYSINENINEWIQFKRHIGEGLVESPEEPKTEVTVSKYFFDFYNMYPKKHNFELAKEKWIELNPDDELAEYIIERLKLWIRSDDWIKDNGKWIPSAHKFIIYKRWVDEPKIKQGWKE